MQIAQARPPYVEFKRIAIHDAVKTQELGRRVTKDVDFAYIMQPGSRDQVERKAVDWLAMIKQKNLDGSPDAYPEEWVRGFHEKYKAWQEGQEMPLNGTSVKEWSLLSPAQAENFISLRILTIEDVAAMTEDALGRYGMGGRELRDKAREWLTKQEVANTLAIENETLKQQLADLSARLAQIETGQVVEKARRGRKPKVTEE